MRSWIANQKQSLNHQHRKQEKKDTSVTLHLIEQVKKGIQALDDQLSRQYDLLERGVYDEELFLNRSKTIKEKQQELSTQRVELEAKRAREEEQDKIEQTLIPYIESVLDLYESADSAEKKNELLKGILEKVEYERIGDNPVTLRIYPRLIPS
ncbi:vacuolar-type H+-ATPase subunit I/STV1 [Croceifilum oryzae]|uniref:Vacuolar-type H+-ATPase subunit I/STV1 n=1 Tax=Croceifilum oryzae TaxID=1553429 RepID=A0AAJ1WSW4_9BACL|nr:hypothetical protein [Croceifilum oryzae]MDQ0417403.1 vacuolar-type H+-ATPase subunit I/STV1 [Croceifilum oryzae]